MSPGVPLPRHRSLRRAERQLRGFAAAAPKLVDNYWELQAEPATWSLLIVRVPCPAGDRKHVERHPPCTEGNGSIPVDVTALRCAQQRRGDRNARFLHQPSQ